jgi:hypothetical protein
MRHEAKAIALTDINTFRANVRVAEYGLLASGLAPAFYFPLHHTLSPTFFRHINPPAIQRNTETAS